MTTLVLSILDESSVFLPMTTPSIKGRMRLIFGKIPSLTPELAALERLNNVVTTLAPSFLIGSSSFL